MFGLAYFHVQALQVVFFALGLFGAYATYKSRALSYVAVFFVAAWLLVLKGIQYFELGRLPMDISAVCYFLYGICAILPFRPLKTVAAQLATLCGLVYGICMIARPDVFFEHDSNEFGRYFAIANHAMLFFGGLAMMGHVRFKKTDFLWTLSAVALIVGYIEACVLYGVPESTAVFPEIVNGNIVYMIFPDFTPAWWYYPVYYAAFAVLTGLWLKLTYIINRRAVPATLQTRFITM